MNMKTNGKTRKNMEKTRRSRRLRILVYCKVGFNRNQISPMQRGGVGRLAARRSGVGGVTPFFCDLFFFLCFFFFWFFSREKTRKKPEKNQKKNRKKQKKHCPETPTDCTPKKKHPPETPTDCRPKNTGLVGLAKRTPFSGSFVK